MATGSGPFGIHFPDYRLRLLTISGGYLVVDWIQLVIDTPAENHSWGSIKASYETE